MKNNKEYSPKIKSLYRSLKREYSRAEKVVYDEPLEALIYGIISENMSEPAAQSAIKSIASNFVNFNDLRVSLEEEIVEMLGQDTPEIRNTVCVLKKVLGNLFRKYNEVSLEALKKIGKRPAKKILEQMEGVSNFAVNYCMLTSLGGHAIPLTARMTEYLRSNELVHPEADEQEIEGFLARQISAANGYEFYALLRGHSESDGRRAKKKARAKSVPKTTKKKASQTRKKTGTKKSKK